MLQLSTHPTQLIEVIRKLWPIPANISQGTHFHQPYLAELTLGIISPPYKSTISCHAHFLCARSDCLIVCLALFLFCFIVSLNMYTFCFNCSSFDRLGVVNYGQMSMFMSHYMCNLLTQIINSLHMLLFIYFLVIFDYFFFSSIQLIINGYRYKIFSHLSVV